VIDAVVAAKARAHPVSSAGDAVLSAAADAAALEQALGHLVQNAIEASEPADPVEVRAFESGGDVAIEVIDRGCGMSEDFICSRLFQPFVSTKETGFGIGAYEARALVRAMGGRLEVESAVGEGTRFTLILPGTLSRSVTPYERMRA
jgi:signal transduction histidine kinase